MNDQSKTKEELIIELQELQQKRDSLQALYDKDISESKRFDEEQYRMIIQNTSDKIFSLNPDGAYRFVNDAYTRYSNMTPAEIIGKTPYDIFPPDQADKRIKLFRRMLETGEKTEAEIKLVTRSGEERYSHTTFEPVKDEKGEILWVVGIAKDITERKRAEERLQESEEKLREAQVIGRIGSWEFDVESNNIEWSDETYELYNRNKALGPPTPDEEAAYYSPDQAEALRKYAKLAIEEGKVFEYDLEANLPGGRKGYFAGKMKPVKNSYGKVIKLFGTVQDITDRKLAEMEIQRHAEMLDSIINSIPVMITYFDEHGKIQMINREVVKKLGWTFEEWKTENILAKCYPDPEDYREVLDFMTRKPIGWKDFKTMTKNGTVIDTIWRNISLADGSSLGIGQDITGRKSAEETLRQSEEKYKNIFKNIQDVYYETDIDGTILIVSPSINILSRGLYRSEDLIGRNMFDFYSDPERRKILIQELQKTSRVTDFEIILKNRDGSPVPCSLTCQLMFDESNLPWKIIGNIGDKTERKLFEQELIRAKEKAEESDRLKSAFLANMSHGIRTPMNGILGFAGLLKEPHLSGEEQQQFIGIIEKAGARLLNIINNLISISKVESGQMGISIAETNINEQIEYVYNFLKPEVERKRNRIFFKCILPSKEAIIKTDREKIYAILTNLVNNAFKFTNEGSIEFGYEKKENYLEFFVKDTGIGIPRERQEVIFERFIQADILDTSAFQGAGLGLSISKAYVEMLGGKIWVESDGKGSIFYFTIPYTSEPEEMITTKDIVSERNERGRIKSLKILVAEDDETSDLLLTTIIKNISHEIIHTKTGIETVEACRNNSDLDLVLMDIRMPDMNGYEATNQIREFNKDVIIIAQTAFGLAGDREKAIEAGCNDYIAKPILKGDLEGLIQKYFHR